MYGLASMVTAAQALRCGAKRPHAADVRVHAKACQSFQVRTWQWRQAYAFLLQLWLIWRTGDWHVAAGNTCAGTVTPHSSHAD